ncbi:MAG: hypothetical protein V4590_05250 [Bacteroidota bacterium]
MENRVTGTVSPESVLKIMEAFKSVQDELPFLIELTPAEAKRIVRIDAGRFHFTERALSLAQSEPKLNPGIYELDEIERDLTLCRSLDHILLVANSLVKLIYDTRNQVAYEAFGGGLEIYNQSKRGCAKGVPGAKVAYDELKILFEGQGKTNKPTSTTE